MGAITRTLANNLTTGLGVGGKVHKVIILIILKLTQQLHLHQQVLKL